MAQFLNDRMNKTYATLSDSQELEAETSLVKTYLLEAHLAENSTPAETENLLRSNFVKEVLGAKSHPKIHLSQDASLFCAESTVGAGGRTERVLFYVDCSNPRFWLLHSMNSSRCVDRVITALSSSTQDLDRAWIPAELLEKASGYGAFRGLNLDYDRRIIPDVDFEAPNAPVEFLKMQLWGNKAADVLQILRQKEGFPHETTLAKVKVKFWLSQEGDDEFSIDDIKYNGKITARGTSFQSHITLVSDIYRHYTDLIRRVEHRFSMTHHVSEGRLSLSGEPINLTFSRPIGNLKVFTEKLFSCTEPFRLWGVPVQLSDEFWRVSAVDLHVGSRINFEIAPKFIRIYLPAGSCGNSVLRIYTNLQHHYDALLEATDGESQTLLQF